MHVCDAQNAGVNRVSTRSEGKDQTGSGTDPTASREQKGGRGRGGGGLLLQSGVEGRRRCWSEDSGGVKRVKRKDFAFTRGEGNGWLFSCLSTFLQVCESLATAWKLPRSPLRAYFLFLRKPHSFVRIRKACRFRRTEDLVSRR